MIFSGRRRREWKEWEVRKEGRKEGRKKMLIQVYEL
jgi:hypothetical protein